MDVDALVPIGKLIDRDFPDYSYVPLLRAPFSKNYLKYVKTSACVWDAPIKLSCCERPKDIQASIRDRPAKSAAD